jgi:protein-tyrosine phosphatase
MVCMMTSILFVCSGNSFRSLVAEYALKTQMGPEGRLIVGSAGIEAFPQEIHPVVRLRLLEKGADPSGHIQRKLTRELLDTATLTVAMGANHREFIRREFGREVPLFNQVCYQTEAPILDVHEAIPNWQENLEQSREYVCAVIDHIWAGIPRLINRLPRR